MLRADHLLSLTVCFSINLRLILMHCAEIMYAAARTYVRILPVQVNWRWSVVKTTWGFDYVAMKTRIDRVHQLYSRVRLNRYSVIGFYVYTTIIALNRCSA